jgi:hypothetical protein
MVAARRATFSPMSTSTQMALDDIRLGMASTNGLFNAEVFVNRNFEILDPIYTEDARLSERPCAPACGTPGRTHDGLHPRHARISPLPAGIPDLRYPHRRLREQIRTDLTTGFGGGSFVPIHDWESLGRRIANLASDRDKLRDLILEAARNGKRSTRSPSLPNGAN